ncbi:MAG TPA: SOS response-associated peptidase family protein [Casimicrobiaceae bacterium]
MRIGIAKRAVRRERLRARVDHLRADRDILRPARHESPAHLDQLALAGVYERWRAKDGEVVDSVAIVTTSASADVRALHDRMPVIVSEHDYGRWLDRGVEDVSDLLVPWRGDALRVYPVSTRVNAVANDDPGLCEPVPEPKERASEPPARKRATPSAAAAEPGESLPETLDLFGRD